MYNYENASLHSVKVYYMTYLDGGKFLDKLLDISFSREANLFKYCEISPKVPCLESCTFTLLSTADDR